MSLVQPFVQLSHMGTYRGCDCARAVRNSQSLIRRSGGIADAVVGDDSRRRADSNEGLHNSLYIFFRQRNFFLLGRDFPLMMNLLTV